MEMNVDYIDPRRNDKNIAAEDQRSCSFLCILCVSKLLILQLLKNHISLELPKEL